MARPTVGVEPQTVRAVGMIEARKRELIGTLPDPQGNGESAEAWPAGEATVLAIVRGLDEAEAIILRAVVAPDPPA